MSVPDLGPLLQQELAERATISLFVNHSLCVAKKMGRLAPGRDRRLTVATTGHKPFPHVVTHRRLLSIRSDTMVRQLGECLNPPAEIVSKAPQLEYSYRRRWMTTYLERTWGHRFCHDGREQVWLSETSASCAPTVSNVCVRKSHRANDR